MDCMNESTGILCKAKKCMRKLCSMRVKDSVDLSLTIESEKNAEGDREPCFEKRIRSDTDFNLVKALSVLMAVGVCISLLCLVCSLCSLPKKK